MALCVWIFSASVMADGADVASEFAKAAEDVAEHTGSQIAEELATGELNSIEDALLNSLTPKAAMEEIFGIGANALSEAVRLFLLLSGLIIISSVSRMICGSMGTAAVSEGFGFLSSAAIIAAMIGAQLGYVEVVADFFDRLNSLIGAMIPITSTVLAMGGNIGSATVGTATLYAMLAITQKLCAASVLPVCYTMETAAICSSLGDGGVLDGFVGAVKKIYNFIIGAVMVVFVFSLGSQTAIAGAADTVAARGGKLLASTVIPGVGGAVGDSLRTLAGSVGYIKSVVGIGGIVLLAALTLPTLISLLLNRLVLLVTGALAHTLGCKREGQLLSEMGNVYGFLLGAVSICSIAFAVALALFVKCAVAIE